MRDCKAPVPPEFEPDRLCVLHFTLRVESQCGEIRRETAVKEITKQRQEEIAAFLAEQGERLARVATGGAALTDAMKARILSTFLTLINLRESLDRSASRQAARPVSR